MDQRCLPVLSMSFVFNRFVQVKISTISITLNNFRFNTQNSSMYKIS